MDGNPISGLYPAPPTNQPQGLLQQNPLALIPAYMQLQQLGAQRAVGQAVQGAIGPNGLNTDAAIQTIKNDPNATLGALQGVGTLQQQRAQQIENDTKQFTLLGGQNAAVQNFIAGEAANPNATPDTIRHDAVRFASRNNIDPSMINSVLAGMPATGGKAMQQFWANLTNATQGAGAAATPAEAGIGPQGETYKAPAGAVLGTTGGLVQTALPAGVVEAQQKQKEVSGVQYAGDLADSANYARSIFPLQKAIPALEGLGKTGTGPGTEQRNHIVSFLQSMGVPGLPDQDKIKSYDEANKYLTDWVNANGNISTNDKLAAAFAGNPSTKISNAAAVDVAKSALALRNMKQAQLQVFQQTGLPPDQYSQWVANKWSGKLDDPRAYGLPLMSDSAKTSLNKSLTGPERLKFLSSLKAAKAGQVDNPIPGYSSGGQ